MQPGQILVADHEGVYIIRMIGDVRLTLCVSFDRFIKTMFMRDDFTAIVFDLIDAIAVDSTTLGLMAKISLKARDHKNVKPIILSDSAGINRTLDCMGFAEIFDIIPPQKLSEISPSDILAGKQALVADVANESLTKSKILEAHRILMSMNDKNHETFQDLVKALEDS